MSSSNTSSPTKRSVLSPRPSNILLSPSKRSPFKHQYIGNYNKLSPLKGVVSTPSSSGSPIIKRPKLNFTIFEDKPDTTKQQQNKDEEFDISNKLNHNDQENILQPSKQIKSRSTPKNINSNYRKPLSNLNINEFPGYIRYANDGNRDTQLTDLYQPINFDNEFKSLHKFQSIPSFLTPSRRQAYKYLYFSKSKIFEEQVPEEEVDDEVDVDDVEAHLLTKRKRSFSVGSNDSKLGLIRKNNFTIMSN
ncbi:uncharacterized protein RJT21DRAFT_26298 [Scheffersomyces amazonensis]|uniref:uncharacterized protein n=1 Tax=Scheffersomyces amazonensis TaxID=1078765 RepID=UPI00315DC23B